MELLCQRNILAFSPSRIPSCLGAISPGSLLYSRAALSGRSQGETSSASSLKTAPCTPKDQSMRQAAQPALAGVAGV